MNEKHQAALELAELGYPVFPCASGSKEPLAGSSGNLDATTDATVIDRWWTEQPDNNVAMATKGLVVVDIDPVNGKPNLLLNDPDKMFDMAGAPAVVTPRGGKHFFFKQPPGEFKSSTGKVAPGVDIRADGGYVVVPPSAATTGGYRWLTDPLNDSPHQLLTPPQWVLDGIRQAAEQEQRSNANGSETDEIKEGGRNATLASMAGSMRNAGFSKDEIVAALLLKNESSCKPPLPEREVRAVADSISRYERKKPRPELVVGGDDESEQDTKERAKQIKIWTLNEMAEEFPDRSPPLVDGLFRVGETVNLISSTKIGKSWGAYQLAYSICRGWDWLDRFPVKQGRVLLVDNELQPQELWRRVVKVAARMCELRGEFFNRSDLEDLFHVVTLRGKLKTLQEVALRLKDIPKDKYQLTILDAKYRFAVPGVSENENSADAQFYNRVDVLAGSLNSTMLPIHHATKGSQTDKKVTDVGAGAGAQSRAADCHMVLREHEEEGAFVLDAALRSFAPLDPFAVRWDYPLWIPAPDLRAADLQGSKDQQRRGAARYAAEDAAREQTVETDKKRVYEAMVEIGKPEVLKVIAAAAKRNHDRTLAALRSLMKDGNVVEADVQRKNRKKPYDGYGTAP